MTDLDTAPRLDTLPSFAPNWTLDQRTRRLPAHFYTTLPSDKPGRDPVLVHASPSAAALIDLSPQDFANPAFARAFSGHDAIPGFDALATVYAGHQFGSFVPQLGDGRALTIAEIRNQKGETWDIQLKGAGKTPYSRFADGRAVMRSSIREYLASEAMAALGIPTTRALALIATNEGVVRETFEPGAVVARLAPSFLRFGHFEFYHARGLTDDVKALADHIIETWYPDIAPREDRYEAFFTEIVARTARLMADWMAVGFAHGVMNTDNMSILGLTIDYGPYGFLDAYDPHFICNHSDEGGRYAFDQQPGIGLWNCQALAAGLSSLIPVERLREILGTYAPIFREAMVARMTAKIGITDPKEGDGAAVNELLSLMAKSQADYTLTFRRLSRADDTMGRAHWLDLFAPFAQADASAWADRWLARLGDLAPEQRRAQMDMTNPKYVLRNWVAETAIRAVEDEGDPAPLARIFNVLQTPYDEHPDDEMFAAPPPPAMQGLCVSCSS